VPGRARSAARVSVAPGALVCAISSPLPCPRLVRQLLGGILPLAWAFACGAQPAGCTGHGVELQVLGSGGPEMQDKRASSSYLVWREGKARLLVDAGGGAALRFGESGARMQDLDVVLLSHLHVDHTADLAALIKSSYFEERTRPLPLFGPLGNAEFPATTAYVAALFDPARGIYRYLGEFLRGREGGYVLNPHDTPLQPRQIRTVFSDEDEIVSATRVIHGSVPALAWRVELDHRIIVFSGDTNGDNGNLERLAQGADIFVAHNAVPEGTTGAPRALHMPPSVIGRIAQAAGVHRLVLSHRMLRTLGREEETRAAIARSYAGPVTFANDLDCFR
jgi:ribonuclease BN (tRNA processing enzyme)